MEKQVHFCEIHKVGNKRKLKKELNTTMFGYEKMNMNIPRFRNKDKKTESTTQNGG